MKIKKDEKCSFSSIQFFILLPEYIKCCQFPSVQRDEIHLDFGMHGVEYSEIKEEVVFAQLVFESFINYKVCKRSRLKGLQTFTNGTGLRNLSKVFKGSR